MRGEIRPGEALRQGIPMPASRTALREAIKVLAAKGLVEAKPKIGTRVAPRDAWNLLDPDVMAWQQDVTPGNAFLEKLTEVRAVIEPQAAALAARRADASAITAIEAAFDEMSNSLNTASGPHVEAFVDADIRFHLSILRACGNDLLEQLTRTIYSSLAVSFRTTSRLPGRLRHSLENHRAILRAIADRQPLQAHAAMRNLIGVTAREITSLKPNLKRGRARSRRK
jgi:DNA-binding FadR family transcriptional regulator